MAIASEATQGRAQLTGAALCAGSAASFGAMGIFGKLAYDAGVGVLALLVVRFAIAASILAVMNALRRPRVSLPRRGVLMSALALGAIGYAAQAGLFFGA